MASTILALTLSSPSWANANPEQIETPIVETQPIAPVAMLKMSGEYVDRAALFQKAETHYDSEEYAESFDAFQKLLLHDRYNYEAMIGLGNAALALGLSDDAYAIFKPLSKRTFYGQAMLDVTAGFTLSKIAAGHSRNVVFDLRKALDKVHDDPRLWNALGRHYDHGQLWMESTDAYVKALAIGKGRASVINNLGMSLMMQGRYYEAHEKFDQALSLKPGSNLYDNNRRLVLALDKDYFAAIRGISPERASLLFNDAGYIAMSRGETKLARVLLQRAIKISPVYHAKANANLSTLEAL